MSPQRALRTPLTTTILISIIVVLTYLCIAGTIMAIEATQKLVMETPSAAFTWEATIWLIATAWTCITVLIAATILELRRSNHAQS